MNKSDLEALVDIRIKEAKLLLDNNCYEGAYYLLGYAMECAIKACIAKQVKAHDFPDKQLATASFTHKLGDLLGVAGLKQKMQEKEKIDEEFKLNWAVIKDWSEDARYEHTIEETLVKDFFRAITNDKTGILVWIKSWW